MPAAAMLAALRLIGRELHARTCNGHDTLERLARTRPITGHPIAGFTLAHL